MVFKRCLFVLMLLICVVFSGCRKDAEIVPADEKVEDSGDINASYGDAEEVAGSSDQTEVSVVYVPDSVDVAYTSFESDEPQEYVYTPEDTLKLIETERMLQTNLKGGTLALVYDPDGIYFAMHGSNRELEGYYSNGMYYSNCHDSNGTTFHKCFADVSFFQELFRLPLKESDIASFESCGQAMYNGIKYDLLNLSFNFNGNPSEALWYMSPSGNSVKHIMMAGSTQASPFDGVIFSIVSGKMPEIDWLDTCQDSVWDVELEVIYDCLSDLLGGDQRFVVDTYDEESVPDEIKNKVDEAIENSNEINNESNNDEVNNMEESDVNNVVVDPKNEDILNQLNALEGF